MLTRQLISIIYAGLLTFIYSTELVVFWGYMRFLGEWSLLVTLKVTALVFGITLGLSGGGSARAHLTALLHYFFFIPSIVYIAFNAVSTSYVLAFMILWFATYFLSRIQVSDLGISKLGVKGLPLLAFIASLVLILALLYNGGFGSFNLNLESVYEFRTDATNALPTLLGYVTPNIAIVVVPLILYLGLDKKRPSLVMAAVGLSILLFGVSHHKLVFFTPLFVCFLFYVSKRQSAEVAIGALVALAAATCVLEILMHMSLGSEREAGIFTSYFIRRTLLVPPMIDAGYFEVFQQAEKYYWSTSRITFGQLVPPNPDQIPFFVAKELFDDSAMSANAGILGSGFANAGLLGVAIYALIVSWILAFLGDVGKRLGHPFVFCISGSIILVIYTSTDLVTSILSHGLFLMMLVLVLYPRYARSR